MPNGAYEDSPPGVNGEVWRILQRLDDRTEDLPELAQRVEENEENISRLRKMLGGIAATFTSALLAIGGWFAA